MLPAARGVTLAQQELHVAGKQYGRTILFEGHGSFQTTAQELSSIIRAWGELETVLKSQEFQIGKVLKMVEVMMGKEDVTREVKAAL